MRACERACHWMAAFVYLSCVQLHLFWSIAIVVIYCAAVWCAHSMPWWEEMGWGDAEHGVWMSVREESERSCLPSKRGAQSRLQLTPGDSKWKWMNTNDHRDKKREAERWWGERGGQEEWSSSRNRANPGSLYLDLCVSLCVLYECQCIYLYVLPFGTHLYMHAYMLLCVSRKYHSFMYVVDMNGGCVLHVRDEDKV